MGGEGEPQVEKGQVRKTSLTQFNQLELLIVPLFCWEILFRFQMLAQPSHSQLSDLLAGVLQLFDSLTTSLGECETQMKRSRHEDKYSKLLMGRKLRKQELWSDHGQHMEHEIVMETEPVLKTSLGCKQGMPEDACYDHA